MRPFNSSRNALWLGVFTVAFLLFGACDVPTSGPSFETETGLNTPVVVNKTFSFMGGEAGAHEPLIDTTTSEFDSLFTVGASDAKISIEEEVGSFDIGSLDAALEEATDGMGVDTSLSETVIQGSDLANQEVEANFGYNNGVPPPTSSQETTVPVARETIPFPPGLLAIPEFGGANVEADSLKRATLTGDTNFKNTSVNEIVFTLFNDGTNPTPLTDGEGNPPAIEVKDENGDVIADKSFGATIGPTESEEVKVGVEGETLGENSELVLAIAGNDPEDDLTIDLSPMRYQEATLDEVDQLRVSTSETNSLEGGTGSSQFAGIETRSGTLQLEVHNNLSFPVEIDTLLLENNLQDSALPDDFSDFDVFRDSEPIPSGDTETFDIELEDKGIAKGLDVTLKGALPQSVNTATISADGSLDVSASGSLPVEAMYFWPDGGQVQAAGTFKIQQDRISFDQDGDFVELSAGTLALDNFVSEPTMAFESFEVSFPDLRKAPYGEENSLSVEFPIDAEANPEVDNVDLSDVRLTPIGNEVGFHLQGTLETIPPSSRTASNLRVVRFNDEVQTDVSIGNLEVRALEAGVNPFTIDVTEDVNDDGRLDLSNLEEAKQTSFGNFEGIGDRINGLELTGSELRFTVTTDVGSDAQLYAALQGRTGSSKSFLAGRGNEKSVSSTSSMGDDFYDGSTPVAKENLIQFEVDGVSANAPTGDPTKPSIVLTSENSTVDDFLSTLPTSLRFVAQARLTGDDEGRIRLRRPLTFDAGISTTIPVQVNNSFVVQDTIDADFSALEDVTDPTKDVTVSNAELRVSYGNGIPLGADARFGVLDEEGAEVVSLPGAERSVQLKPAPKADDGTANGAQSGTAVLDLSTEDLRALAQGRQLRLQLTLHQADAGGPATLRATDTIDLSLEAEVEASVQVNE